LSGVAVKIAAAVVAGVFVICTPSSTKARLLEIVDYLRGNRHLTMPSDWRSVFTAARLQMFSRRTI